MGTASKSPQGLVSPLFTVVGETAHILSFRLEVHPRFAAQQIYKRMRSFICMHARCNLGTKKEGKPSD